jgi:hypothetical protein
MQTKMQKTIATQEYPILQRQMTHAIAIQRFGIGGQHGYHLRNAEER